QCKLREPALLGVIHRRGGPLDVVRRGGAHLDEDDAAAVERDEVDLAVRAAVVPLQDRQSLALEIAGRGALGTCAKQAPPPGFARVHDTPLSGKYPATPWRSGKRERPPRRKYPATPWRSGKRERPPRRKYPATP